MKKNLIAGLAILLPIAITLVVTAWLFDLVTTPLLGMVKYVAPESIVIGAHGELKSVPMFFSRMIALGLLLGLICLCGIIGRRVGGNLAFKALGKLFSRIPVLKTVYKVSQEIADVTFAPTTKLFDETVVLPFPWASTYALGFTVGSVPPPIQKSAGVSLSSCVFVPNSPHLMSGFLLFVSPDVLSSTSLSTEETVRFLLSCGMLHPESSKISPL